MGRFLKCSALLDVLEWKIGLPKRHKSIHNTTPRYRKRSPVFLHFYTFLFTAYLWWTIGRYRIRWTSPYTQAPLVYVNLSRDVLARRQLSICHERAIRLPYPLAELWIKIAGESDEGKASLRSTPIILPKGIELKKKIWKLKNTLSTRNL